MFMNGKNGYFIRCSFMNALNVDYSPDFFISVPPLSVRFFDLLEMTRTSARTSPHPSSMNSDAIDYSPPRPLTLPTIILRLFNSGRYRVVDYRCFLRWHDDFWQHHAQVSLQKQPSLYRALLAAKNGVG